MKAQDCIFCKIAAGEASAYQVYQDEWVTAFLDIAPINPGHVLVIPNRHAANLAELSDEMAQHMIVVARRMAGFLRNSLSGVEGINLLLADGVAAGQTVFHCHLHVVPRYTDDGFGFSHAHSHTAVDDERMQTIQQNLRAVINSGDK